MRTLAEWEKSSAVLMAFPHENTDWIYILDESQRQFAAIVKALTDECVHVVLLVRNSYEAGRYLRDIDNRYLRLIEMEFNDTWTRDYGPIKTQDSSGFIKYFDFGFNGWGLKFAADKDNLVNLHLSEADFFIPHAYVNHRDFILEGGSVETDGKGTLLTTSRCLCSPNRNGGLSQAEVETLLKERLGFERVLWLDYGFLEGDDTDSHIDTLARFGIDGKTIVYCGPGNEEGPQHESLMKMKEELSCLKDAEGKPYRLLELPLPDSIYDENGDRLPATYANYLVLENKLFMPVYSQPDKDALAVEIIGRAFPDHKIITVDCTTLIKQHGSLHCSTMQL